MVEATSLRDSDYTDRALVDVDHPGIWPPWHR